MSVGDLVRRARHPRAPLSERHAAFTRLVERFEHMAFASALSACDDTALARDACQEAFLVAWRSLHQLHEPAAFGGWLRRLVRTQCSRVRRARRNSSDIPEAAIDFIAVVGVRDTQRRIRRVIASLPPTERRAVVLFYFLGEPLRAIARELDTSVGNAGKILYGARLHLRRKLPRSLAQPFVLRAPTPAFTRAVAAGVLDEFVGEYRFPERPDRPVVLRREGSALVSYSGDQRHVLASRGIDALTTREFDGEGRFRRDRRGRISHFVYYEFGRRLGIARKVS